MDDRHAGVTRGPGVAQFAAVVRAAVVHQDAGQPACHVLGDNALDAAVQRSHGLVDRHNDGDGRLAHWAPPFSVMSRTMRTNSA